MHTLKHGETVTFFVDEEEYIYEVCYSHLRCVGFFSNDKIFRALGIDKYKTTEQCYTYTSCGGAWPRAIEGDFEAMTRLVEELHRLCEATNHPYII